MRKYTVYLIFILVVFSVSFALYPDRASQKAKEATDNAISKPLLHKINYGQEFPYDVYCPEFDSLTQCTTGCVATAMAMIMKYYGYPAAPTGKINYTTLTNNYHINEDLSKFRFDWKFILPNYFGNFSDNQIRSVAALCYACAISVYTDFGKTSFSNADLAIDALINNFGFSPAMEYLDRDSYQEEEWISILKKEIDAGRPIIYVGTNSDAGHAFICDGYDADNKFHFNWGWDSYCNGYYNLNDLVKLGFSDPKNTGFSGAIEVQKAIVGIQPEENNGNYLSLMAR